MRLTLSRIGEILGGAQPRGEAEISGAAIDSRSVKPGDLFVCIAGARVDGHDYAARAAEAGAAAILASRPLPGLNIPVFVAEDVISALGRLAAWSRRHARAKVICLTGTAGKTTLKETLAAILGEYARVAVTEKNHNNQIGLPQAILNADGEEDFWILEAGINHAGDMDYLGAIAAPDLAIILNAGPGHIEGLGGKGVAWNKTRLLNYLNPDGEALVCSDYPELVKESEDTGVLTRFFSTSGKKAEFGIIGRGGDGFYELDLDGARCGVKTPFFGEYGAETALCAAAAAHMAGCDCQTIKKGFSVLRLPPQRFNKIETNGLIIFDCTYNANPLSMRRMLEAAADYARTREMPLVAVLGEMGELGPEAGKWHYALGKILAQLAPAAIFWKGAHRDDVQNGLEGADIPLLTIEKPDNFMDVFGSCPQTRDTENAVLIFMGSRSNGLENYLGAFLKGAGERKENVL